MDRRRRGELFVPVFAPALPPSTGLTFELVVASLNCGLGLKTRSRTRLICARFRAALLISLGCRARYRPHMKGIESVFRRGREEQRDVPVCNLSIVGTLSR
jgi:hypothetical protein